MSMRGGEAERPSPGQHAGSPDPSRTWPGKPRFALGASRRLPSSMESGYGKRMLKDLSALLEKVFRRSALRAYAMNQSRAKLVLDPIYLAVARVLLRGTDGPSAKLLGETFPSNLYFSYRAQSRKLAYYIEDW